ncbi:F-box/kelch-repeat protein At3g61590-like [Syzygium oleosum]|uniref:F-box/kelch-repeat protein At3g61590-like n=1 Tax=Syzygium oleosum TaxID=219896 RepID=UPI0024B8E09F|nr:F-box/kelch-repeat protein At3g61590-like [Syzygium oleosum]
MCRETTRSLAYPQLPVKVNAERRQVSCPTSYRNNPSPPPVCRRCHSRRRLYSPSRWRGIITSETFQKKLLLGVSQRPWTLRPPPYGYDPVYNVWYKLELPIFIPYYRFVKFASSTGLISVFVVDECGIPRLYVGNPLTRRWREIAQGPSVKSINDTDLAISVSRTTLSYIVSIVTTKDLRGVLAGQEFSIHLYDSETRMWETRMTEALRGWTSGYQSAICDGVLYFLIHSTGDVSPENSCRLVMCDLSERCSNGLSANFVPVPCPRAHGRLMNMKEKLVLVGGIYKGDGALFRSIQGVGIWVLSGREWHEIARLPDDYVLGLGSFPWLHSYDLNDLIYFLRERDPSPHIVTFDKNQKQWSRNSFAPLLFQVGVGFCFEPQLDIVP